MKNSLNLLDLFVKTKTNSVSDSSSSLGCQKSFTLGFLCYNQILKASEAVDAAVGY